MKDLIIETSEDYPRLDGKALFDKMESIRGSISEGHTLLAKATIPSEQYNPISKIMAEATLDLLQVHQSVSYMDSVIDAMQELLNEKCEYIERLNKIIETKESERVEWSGLAIKKQQVINDLIKKM